MNRYLAPLLAAFLSFLSAAGQLHADAPSLLYLSTERVLELQSAVQVPGSHHAEAYAAMKYRVDTVRADFSDLSLYDTGANPRDSLLGYFAREAAMVYLITGDPDYAQSTFAALYKVYNDPDPYDSRLLTNAHGLSRGTMGVSFALAYNWAWTGLTPQQREWLFDRLTEGLNMWPTFNHTNLGGSRASNWMAVIRGSELIMLLATEEDKNRLVRYNHVRSELRRHIQTYSRQGWTHEGNGYIGYGGRFLVPALLALSHRGDNSLLEDYITRSGHALAMFSGAFDEAQSVTQWGVGGAGFDPEGWISAMLGIIPNHDLPYYLWFYDRFRGIHNPAAAQDKFDQRRGGTAFSLIYYPEHLTAQDPHEAFSSLFRDPDAGFWMRSGWNDQDDVIVSLSADAKGFNQGWDEADALQINILYGGTHFARGPGKSQEPALFSSLLVNGQANNSIAHRGRAGESFVSPNGAYAVVEGHEKYANLGLASVRRHVLTDFSGTETPAIISVLDSIQNEHANLYTWQLNTMNLPTSSGMESGGVMTFTVNGDNDTWLKGWVLTPGAILTAGANISVDLSAADADIWVVMAVGKGTPLVATISGTGLSSVLTLGSTHLSFDAATGYLQSSAVPDLQRPPTASFSATPVVGLPPQAVVFNASGSSDPDGDPLSYHWDFGDGTTAADSQVSKTFEQEGHYVVRLRVSDGRGGTDLATRVIHVGNRAPTARIAATPTSGLPPLAVNLDATASSDPEGDPLTYEWRLGTNGPTAYGPVVDHVFQAGNHQVSLIVRDSAGNWDTATVSINAQNQPPVARARSFPSGGSTQTVIQFDGSRSTDPEGMPLTYTWNFGDGTVLTDAGPFVNHTFSQPGSYRVRLTVTDPLGASHSHLMDAIQIIAPGDLRVAVSPPPGLVPGLNYKYYQGSYQYVPNLNAKSPIKTGRVETFNHQPRDQEEMFQFVYAGYILIPEDGAYVFHLRSIGGSLFFIGDDLVVDADFWQVGTERWATVGLKAGYHPIRVHYNYRNAGNYGRDPHLLDFHWFRPGATSLERVPPGILYSSPSILASSLMSSPSEGTAPLTVVFEATTMDPEGGELTYLWDFGDGNTSTQRKATHTFTQNGSYEVTLRVVSSSGASDLSGTTVHVAPHRLRKIDKTDEPGGIVFARGENGTNEGRLRAFDNSVFTKWLDFSPVTWIEYHFNQGGMPRQHVIGMYSISSANDAPERDPYNWTLSGSNDGVNWTVLDTRTGERFLSRHQTRYFFFNNTHAYSAYRFDIECRSGTITQLSQIELFDLMTTPSPATNQAPTGVGLVASRLSGEAPLRVDFSLSASDPEGDLLYYDWDFGDGQVTGFSIHPDVSHTFHTIGTHTVTATVRDSQNAIVERTVQIQVLPPSANTAPVIHLTTSATQGTAHHTVHFDASQSYDPDGDPFDFHWEFGDGFVGNGAVVAHTYRTAGTYTATLYAKDARGRRSVETRLIEVAEPETAALGVISLNIWNHVHRDNIAWHEAAGAVPVANWNNVRSDTARLLNHRGEETPVTFSLPFGYNYRTDAIPVNGDEKLVMGFHGTIQSSPRSYTLSSIPYTQYDLYVYNGGAGTHGTPVGYSVDGETYWMLETDNVFDGVLSESLATTAGAAEEGNEFVVFRGLTKETVEIVVDGNLRAGPSGFQIVGTSDGPVARPDFVLTDVDTPVDILPLSNDRGNNLVLHSVGEPSAGTVDIIDSATLRFTPPESFNGFVVFAYTIVDDLERTSSSFVEIQVGTPNLPPVAVDDVATMTQGGSIVIAVLANDCDPENDPISLTGLTQPANGAAYILEDGTVRYTPHSLFSGVDTFMYFIEDSEGNFASATVTVTVEPISVSDTISINIFNTDNSLDANQTAGVVPRANWNNFGPQGRGPHTLMGSDGLQSGARVLLPEIWRYSTPQMGDTADHIMMSGYAGRSVATLQFEFSDIPFESYDVYVYWGAHQDEWIPDFLRVTVEDETFWIRVEDTAWNGTFVQSTATTKAAATTPANYVVFENLSLRNLTVTTFADTANNRLRAGPAGIQIVARTTPPPDGASYAAWLNDNGLDGSGASAPGASLLQDGVPNLLKYLAGIAPTEVLPAEYRPRTEHVSTPEGDRLLFTYRTRADRTDVECIVEESTDLIHWTPADRGLAETVPNDDGCATHHVWSRIIPHNGAVFIRLRMVLSTAD